MADPSAPAGLADRAPLFTWTEREGGAVEVVITPPHGRRVCLAAITLATAEAVVPLVAGVVAAPADVSVVVGLVPAG